MEAVDVVLLVKTERLGSISSAEVRLQPPGIGSSSTQTQAHGGVGGVTTSDGITE